MTSTKDDPGKRVSEIAAQTVAMFLQEKMPEIMRAIDVRIRAEFGGEQVHFRKDVAERRAVRNAMIARDFAAGMTTRAVAKKWNISKSQAAELRRILLVPNQTLENRASCIKNHDA